MLQEVKAELKITWNDEDESLKGIIARGEKTLTNIMGVTLNFDEQTEEKALLLNYCRYAYNNALEYFEQNFASDILRIQLQKAVEEDNAENTQ